MFKQVIVVEGIHDEERLRSFLPGVETISVNGSEINDNCLKMLKELSKTRDLVLFFDPDYPGQRIRNIIDQAIPGCSHAFIKKSDAISRNKKKVGVEHASKEVIIEALENILTYQEQCSTEHNSPEHRSLLTTLDLFNLGLIGNNNSKALRDKVCDHYKIDYPNGKTILKRLNMLGLKVNDIKEVIYHE